jgi:hypothetical protein
MLQVGEDAPRSFMSNEVAEEVCGFREVLGRLMLNGKCEFELIFIFDCLYEDGALFTPRQKVEKLRISLPTRRWSLVHGSSVIRGRLISLRSGIDENKRAVISVKVSNGSRA